MRIKELTLKLPRHHDILYFPFFSPVPSLQLFEWT